MIAVTDRHAEGVAPERSQLQRMEALTLANEIRLKRCRLKRDLKDGRCSIATLLLNPPDYIETAKVYEMLRAMPRYGDVKVNKILTQCRISLNKTIGGLSRRQRGELASFLMSREDTAEHREAEMSAQESPRAQRAAQHAATIELRRAQRSAERAAERARQRR
jgi:hypothetical protein